MCVWAIIPCDIVSPDCSTMVNKRTMLCEYFHLIQIIELSSMNHPRWAGLYIGSTICARAKIYCTCKNEID